ncbi:MAG: DEAD/DEAH box helicase family protein [Desulfobacterales bacterium]|nr:DEAD/DEAH box helicase family protein [Desulfobacterales bacterium]MBF0396733.1 DEAD/DEAH box helicase family protein [Desulfobacterales bacterium]
MNSKKNLSERDICTKLIMPALEKAGWDKHTQILEEVSFTAGKIYVRGKLSTRGKAKRADYILYYKPNIPIAVIEAKDNNHSIRAGIQQSLEYAQILDIPFAFSSNGDGFLFHDKTIDNEKIETEIGLDDFPSPEKLWEKYKLFKNLSNVHAEKIISQDYYFDSSNRTPRYYQQIAINRSIEAIATGKNRILLVMATGTGKTYVAFQIIYRLWKAGIKKRILFLADRNVLIDQARRGDFKYFKDKMTVVKNRQVDKSYEIYFALYQGLSGSDEDKNIYKQFSKDFFDLIVIDECHRSSAREDSAWHDILVYFDKAAHIGLTATPKETRDTSNIEYFGDPIYIYSLKQGIEDGFLAPYRVIRIGLNVDLEGFRPEQGKKDIYGNLVEDRIYNRNDYDKNIVIEERTDIVAKKLTEFLKGYDSFAKTIVFCVDIDHAERMRMSLAKHNADFVSANYKYVMQITGDNEEGKRELDNFIDPDAKYPVIATTSELMTTGVDAQTCKVIVLDCNISSMTKFKQIIGRGTRICEEYGKYYFTILDFRNATDLFADINFDGEPIRIKAIQQDDDLGNIIEEEEKDTTPIIDDTTGEEILIDPPLIRYPEPADDNSQVSESRTKTYINGIDVSVLITRELYFDNKGKPITTSLKDHTREIIKDKFATLNDFLNKWHSAERKEIIIKELEEQGVLVEALLKSLNKEIDLFDLVCNIAFDKPPLTRKERANNVKKRNYFTQYEEQARKVLEALLDKYSDEGIENIEKLEVLKVKPLTDFGSPIEIIKIFGGKEKYLEALKKLEKELYKAA